MNETILEAHQLEKIYRVYANPLDRLKELVTRRPRHDTVEALVDLSFELRRGESLAIIGENGAGKSTLLSVLAGVTSPTRGRLEVRGSVASLLELGMGFHPELTGRQNIRLTAAMMGLNEAKVEALIPEIIDFSELGDFIDRPVKIYSTGMNMRLGFAIAVQVEPEILIVDEALSVGDGYFQKKCMDRIHRFVSSGRTLLFCSHALYYVSAYCQRALWLEKGHVRALGPVEKVVREYEAYLLDKGQAARQARQVDGRSGGGKLASITAVRQLGDGAEAAVYQHRDPWVLEVEWETRDPELAFHVGIGIDRIDDVQICTFGTHRDQLQPLKGKLSYRIRLLVPELPILKGEFSLYVFLLDERGTHVYDQYLLQTAFSVESRGFQVGLVHAEHRWDFEPASSPQVSSPPTFSTQAVDIESALQE